MTEYDYHDKKRIAELEEHIKGKENEFLFGEGACIKEDVTNGYPSFTIEGACYELRNVRTINTDWTYQEVKE